MAPAASKMCSLCCLPDGYGFVVLSAIGNHFVNIWMAINVGRARKQYKIEYPTMYDPENKKFNCIQRAHQNTLENYPNFLYLLFIGGLQYPKIVAGAGVLYSLSRIAFAMGYYTGEPKNRRWGAFGHIAELLLLGSAISWACHQLKWVGTGVKC